MSRPPSPPLIPQRRPSVPRPPPSPLSPSTTSTPLATTASIPPHPTRRSSRPSTPTTPPTNKARARDLLRKHYGLGVGPPPPLSGKAMAEDPMNLDSSAFDAKTYYEQLITTSSLPTLLKRENELVSEIKELDSERQSLVYNHHHELIAARDTIAAMKARVVSLDTDMDLLKVAFSEISRLGAEVANERKTSGVDASDGE